MNKLCRSLILMLCMFALPVMAAETDEKKELGFWFEAQRVSKNPSVFWDSSDRTSVIPLGSSYSSGKTPTATNSKWKPTEWLELGIGIGRETVPDKFTATGAPSSERTGKRLAYPDASGTAGLGRIK